MREPAYAGGRRVLRGGSHDREPLTRAIGVVAPHAKIHALAVVPQKLR
jgi:hypothetical protein